MFHYRASVHAMRDTLRPWLFWFKVCAMSFGLALAVVVALIFNQEVHSSVLQARIFSTLAGQAQYVVQAGPNQSMRFPRSANAGPYDERLGYTDLERLIANLRTQHFDISRQARLSPRMIQLADAGIFTPYPEKDQAGLTIYDQHQKPLFHDRYPERIFERFEDVPPILVAGLLYVENRELLDERYPNRDPAVEWDRLAKAVLDQSVHAITRQGRAPGGSTLATQIEKYRHSPEGRTTSFKDKLRQMLSAAMRAYQQGEDTSVARRQIVIDYLNTMPLSARAGFGEVNGIGDGLWVWYGRDFSQVAKLLHEVGHDTVLNTEQQLAMKQAISLLIAQRRPSFFFSGNDQSLDDLTNSYIRLLTSAGILSESQRDALLEIRLRIGEATLQANSDMNSRKSADSVRLYLANLLGGLPLYKLDRMDLDVTSTIDADVQTKVNELLRKLRDPIAAERLGFHEHQLLETGDTDKVIYSFTLYERGAHSNYLRIQTDNFDQPFNVNEGTKLDLGSTAKLRTLVTYLDIVAELHKRYSALSKDELSAIEVDSEDVISQWAVSYLRSDASHALGDMLEAALDRSYSANPSEEFFTGGGVHKFDNFRHEDDGRIMSVRDGLRNSVNLVFIRLLRDISRHYMYQMPGSSARLLKDINDPRRAVYLTRFADQEGKVFIQRFFRKYEGMRAADIRDSLVHAIDPTPARLSTVYRTLEPERDINELADYLQSNFGDREHIDAIRLKKLYTQYSPARLSLLDRGFVSGIHPLELWTAAYLSQHPGAKLHEVLASSEHERREVYQWLFAAHRKQAQDKRIVNMLEMEGFAEIHKQWKRMGFPFDSLVPSYATALGASADRPAALAELMGILVNDGVRKPIERVSALHFAVGTPYETELLPHLDGEQRVLPAEVARAVRGALRLVVRDGTARRVNQAFKRGDGSLIEVGGKTGTGDHRFDTIDAHGNRVDSRVVDRTATFVFNIDERFFGTITAYVHGEQAADYHFTSALPVQILKVMAPSLMPLWTNDLRHYAQNEPCSKIGACAALE